ncbi:MAG: hypothetical protein R3311_09920 [Oceanisphaera sp.]|nr:hypothetical protein [Oceanisphaera sp.]
MAVIDPVKKVVLSRRPGVLHLGLVALLLSLAGCMSPQGFNQGDVMLYWETPQERRNGNLLPLSELGGFVIRYKATEESDYFVITINDNHIDQYLLEDIDNPHSAIIEVAAFDSEGRFSSWIRARQ